MAYGVDVNGDRVPVIQTGNGIELPKDTAELGEAPESVAVRETTEETGEAVELTGEPSVIVTRASGMQMVQQQLWA